MTEYIEGNKYNINGIDYIYVNIGKITLGHYFRGLCCKYCLYIYKNIKNKKEQQEKIENGRFKISKLLKLLEDLYYNKEKKDFLDFYNELYNDENYFCIREDLKSIYFYFILI